MATRKHCRQLACCLIVSTLLAAVIVAHETLFRHEPGHDREAFQSLVGGLGFGSSVDLSRCGFGFDPRLEPACSHMYGPIPAGSFLCSQHGGSATGYPSLPLSPDLEMDADEHATSR